MTTDTKAVSRWDYTMAGSLGLDPIGPYVEFTDHERVVGELEIARDYWKGQAGAAISDVTDLRDTLATLNEAQAVCDGTIPSALLHWHQRALAAESALAASRAEVEGLKKDAERYRWIRSPHSKQAESLVGMHVDDQLDYQIDKARGE